MINTARRFHFDPNCPSERLKRASDWHLPRVFKQLFPLSVINGLRELKGLLLTRDFPRNIEFEQSQQDSQASASMSIVVPIHDAPDVTRRCLASLKKYAPESEIILVDDGSVLSETEAVIKSYSGLTSWKVVRHEHPAGHSAACRTGAGFATRPYLCLLNSDTVVTPWCWQRVKEAFESDPNIGVAGPSTSNSGNPQTLPLAATLLPYWNDNQICNFANRLLANCPEPAIVDLDWASGFALFIRRSLWEELGGFDRHLADYGNEVELCKRVRQIGHRIVWIRNSYIHHLGQRSYGGAIGHQGILARIRAAETYIDKN
jgi:GT2 family glycosyltransferase